MDTYLERLTTANPNLLVPWYLMMSYLYYCEDEPIISDTTYDILCLTLRDKWREIKHWHKHLIDYDNLEAGTGFNRLAEDYPERIKAAAHKLQRVLERTIK